jgi:hypothetical protein
VERGLASKRRGHWARVRLAIRTVGRWFGDRVVQIPQRNTASAPRLYGFKIEVLPNCGSLALTHSLLGRRRPPVPNSFPLLSLAGHRWS